MMKWVGIAIAAGIALYFLWALALRPLFQNLRGRQINLSSSKNVILRATRILGMIIILAGIDYLLYLVFPGLWEWVFQVQVWPLIFSVVFVGVHLALIANTLSSTPMSKTLGRTAAYFLLTLFVVWVVRLGGPYISLYAFGVEHQTLPGANLAPPLALNDATVRLSVDSSTMVVEMSMRSDGVVVRNPGGGYMQIDPGAHLEVVDVYTTLVTLPEPYDLLPVGFNGARQVANKNGKEVMEPVRIRSMREYKDFIHSHKDEQFAPFDAGILGAPLAIVGTRCWPIVPNTSVFYPDSTRDRRIIFAHNTPIGTKDRGTGRYIIEFKVIP